MSVLTANGGVAHSWYHATARHPGPFASLDGSRRVDVAIIGGGLTGLSAALALAKAGADVAVFEAWQIGFGASGRNGGQVGSGQRVDQITLEQSFGADTARLLWGIGEAAKSEVKTLAQKHEIDAGWKPGIAQVARRPGAVEGLHRYANHLRDTYGYDQVKTLNREEAVDLVGSKGVAGGVLDQGASHIHPLRFTYGLAAAASKAGAAIYEETPVSRIEGRNLYTGKGIISAGQILIATNGYTANLNQMVAARVLAVNAFIGVTEPLKAGVLKDDIAVVDDRFVVNYWRTVDGNRLLFGGGESYGLRFPKNIAAKVRHPMTDLYPALKGVRFDYVWGGTLGITTTRQPYFAEVEPGIFTAAGYSGHGVALATLGGRLVAEAILGKPSDFALMTQLNVPPVPGGPLARHWLTRLAMHFYAARDRIGV
ncbi:MAG: FAD-binding oxidoreductase [Pseudomonadota bacterium]